MTAQILIGTSGYSYDDWVGPVYPPGTTAKDFLRRYSDEFDFTELNFSYYTQPQARTVARMVHAVPGRFRFAIKAFGGLTHHIGTDFAAQAAVFREGIAPLVEAGMLSAVVAQFPFSFHYTPPNRTHLKRLCDELSGLPLAVELRNNQWQRDSVVRGLAQRGVAVVNVDGPDLPGLPQPSALVTAPHAYVRLHGRNAAAWWQGDNASRYDYSYTVAQLGEWLPRLLHMAPQSRTLIVAFNNHWRGQAVANARTLRSLVTQALAQESHDSRIP